MMKTRVLYIATLAVLAAGCTKQPIKQPIDQQSDHKEFVFTSSSTDVDVLTRSTTPMDSYDNWGGVIGVIDKSTGNWFSDTNGTYDPRGKMPGVKFSIAEAGILAVNRLVGDQYTPLESVYQGNFDGRILVLGKGTYTVVSLGVAGGREVGEIDGGKFVGDLYPLKSTGTFDRENASKDDLVYAIVDDVKHSSGQEVPQQIDMVYNHAMALLRFEVWKKNSPTDSLRLNAESYSLSNVSNLKIMRSGYIDITTGQLSATTDPSNDKGDYLNNVVPVEEYLVMPTVQDGKEIYKLSSAVINPIIVRYNEEQYFVPFDIGGQTNLSLIQNKCRVVAITINPTTRSTEGQASVNTYLEEFDNE